MWSLAVVRNCVPILNAVNWTKSKVFPQSDKTKISPDEKQTEIHGHTLKQDNNKTKLNEARVRFIFFDFYAFPFLSKKKKKSAHKNSMNEKTPQNMMMNSRREMNEWMNERKPDFRFFIISSQKREFTHSETELDYGFSALLVLLWRDKWKRNAVRW